MYSRYQPGNTDRNGNFRGQSRKREGYLVDIEDDLPFPALVVAWYPKSQTITVARPENNALIEYESVVVYGDFFDATGTIKGPKIATQLKDDGFTTYRDSDQEDEDSEKYVLDNHIEALVFKTTRGYAANSFRIANADSPLLNNCEQGRIITRYDDGSYFIHDEDGNMQFKHPSGLNIRIGDNVNDITLDTPFPDHEKNKQAYASGLKTKIEIPINSTDKHIIDIDSNIAINHATGGKIELDGSNITAEQGGTTLKVTSSWVEVT